VKGQQARGERGAHSYLDARAKGCARLRQSWHPIIGPISAYVATLRAIIVAGHQRAIRSSLNGD